MDVNDVVEERIQAARIRIAAAKKRREELSAARARGLRARHAQKLRNLRAVEARANRRGIPTVAADSVSAAKSSSKEETP